MFGDKTVYVYPQAPIFIQPRPWTPYWVYTSGDGIPSKDSQIWSDNSGNEIKMSFTVENSALCIGL